MSYLVLARKWRPQGFDDIIGQDPIVKVLQNSIEQGKLAHAYVFSGPRGVGKTSSARILAKALNCAEGPTISPCGKCPACLSIVEGSDVDVIEIDGASNNSVDNIRDLRERVKYAPSGGKNKVYIIDEAHMLSTSAFNALLKTLEEPPPHVIFVMATTEARKIPLTVMSRCQHLPFRRVSTKSIRDRLRDIALKESIDITDGALSLVARAADGSIRDSLTILDQVTSFSSSIDEENIKNLLDIADTESLASVAGAVLRGEREEILRQLEELVERGSDLRAFTKDLIKFFRDMMVSRVVSSTDGLLDLSDEEKAAINELIVDFPEEHLSLVVSELIKAEADIRNAFSPRVSLEMSLIKASYLNSFSTINEVIEALGGETKDVIPGIAPPRPAPSPTRATKDNYRTTKTINDMPAKTPDPVKAAPAPVEKKAAASASIDVESAAASEKGAAAPAVIDEIPENTPEKETVVSSVAAPDKPALPETQGKPEQDTKDISDAIADAPRDKDETDKRDAGESDAQESNTFFTSETILKAMVERLEEHNAPLSSRLSQAKPELTPDVLNLTFASNDAELCAMPFKEDPTILEKLASEIREIPTKIEIHITHNKKTSSSRMKEKAKSDPVVMEALDLFDGRIVHVRNIDDE